MTTQDYTFKWTSTKYVSAIERVSQDPLLLKSKLLYFPRITEDQLARYPQ